MNDVIDTAWLDTALRAACARAVAALFRYFGDLDIAEEAFQEASLRALQKWPENGPPRDPAAWLILVGRNSGIDAVRRRQKERPLPDEHELSDLEDAEPKMAERLDDASYRDDVLRLLFVCCHPELPGTQQIALALRLVCGLSVGQIARAFLVSDAAMEQRITRAKQQVNAAGLSLETPGRWERSERLDAVATVIYLMFNEGYSATGAEAPIRTQLSDEAIRLARLLLRLFPDVPAIMALLALMLIQHARARARLDADGNFVLLEDQDRSLWDHEKIEEGLALIEKASRHGKPDKYQVQAAIAAVHGRAVRPEQTDWAKIEALYEELERLVPSPVVTLNRAVAISKTRGAEAALRTIEPLSSKLSSYFYFFGVKGALLLELHRADEARSAFNRAITLANSAAEVAHIRMQLDRLTSLAAARSN